jgi:hypothetical protein
MPTRSEAEEHLRIIRSLMEKATIYRAVSAPTALVGGVCAMVLGLGMHFYRRTLPPLNMIDGDQESWPFILNWIVVFAVTCVANTWFLWRDARRRNDPFISPGMKQALKCLVPPMLAGAFTTFVNTPFFLPFVWMIFYGLALLATAPFAPRSIPRLGWVFLLTGLVTLYLRDKAVLLADPHLIMASTFGLFHLIYAACTWPQQAPASDTGGTP